jgi:hypothetical protein
LKRLGPWLRLGIVLTVAWMLIAPLVIASRVQDDHQRLTLAVQSACLERAYRSGGPKLGEETGRCTREAEASSIENAGRFGSNYRDSIGASFALDYRVDPLLVSAMDSRRP